MKEINKYRVLDVREGDKTIWNITTHSVSSEHYYVFILERLESKKRTSLYLTSEKIMKGNLSEHHLVITGDIIKVISETDFDYKSKYKIEIIEQ